MGQTRHGVRRKFVRIEQWEIEMAAGIARSLKTSLEPDDLEAELLGRLLELKQAKPAAVRDWRGFLARSLYNAATDLQRRWNVRHKGTVSLDEPLSGEEQADVLADTLAAPEESIGLGIDLAEAMKELPPELRELWFLLVEEDGNGSSLARRIGRPIRTVAFQIGKIRAHLEKRGLDEAKK